LIDQFPAYWNNEKGPGTTRARLLWDDEALYFAGAMDDTELRTAGKKRNDRIWEGDVFELFFKPKDDRPEYYEFQVNPRSVPLELPPLRGLRPPPLRRRAAVAIGRRSAASSF